MLKIDKEKFEAIGILKKRGKSNVSKLLNIVYEDILGLQNNGNSLRDIHIFLLEEFKEETITYSNLQQFLYRKKNKDKGEKTDIVVGENTRNSTIKTSYNGMSVEEKMIALSE